MSLGHPSPGVPLTRDNLSCSPVDGGWTGLAPAETRARSGEHQLMLSGIVQGDTGGGSRSSRCGGRGASSGMLWGVSPN